MAPCSSSSRSRPVQDHASRRSVLVVLVLLVGAPLLLLPLENRWFEKMPQAAAFWVRMAVVAIPVIFVLLNIIPMLTGGSPDGLDEMDEMMKMYQ